MALGPFAFQAIGFGLTDMQDDLQTPWAEVSVVERFDALQWVGPKSLGVTISGVLFPESFGGLGTLEGIRAAAIAGMPLMLVTRAGAIHGLHVVFGVSRDHSLLTRRALPRRTAYKINLRKL